ALGVRDAQYEKFDIKPILERLLLKGSIVVKKAYCDWERYKAFKAGMHEANFELIEIPHVRQSGKNSADIRLVVDALDLCYTKAHVNTFVIISGDSDFSPLVSKLRENAKQVIGVGVKKSTSDLLIANCDEFIFYDDLVRGREQRPAAPKNAGQPKPQKGGGEEDQRRREELEARRGKAIDLAMSTLDALLEERGDAGRIWSSMLKQAIKRRRPDFNESYFGFKAFGNLLEEAQSRGLIELGRDDKGGPFVSRRLARPLPEEPAVAGPAATMALERVAEPAAEPAAEAAPVERTPEPLPSASAAGEDGTPVAVSAGEAAAGEPATPEEAPKAKGRRPRKPAAKGEGAKGGAAKGGAAKGPAAGEEKPKSPRRPRKKPEAA
ncbi:MAG: NYN domain-containing protein, partial [Rhodocyclaceae bacterium]|nr:NYN domain-containing protein [Rhodocyclaceae bacterium]